MTIAMGGFINICYLNGKGALKRGVLEPSAKFFLAIALSAG
jgi:hypothetical protein